MVENVFNPGDDFYKKLMETIDAANRKQTLELKDEIEGVKAAIVQERTERSKLEKKYLDLKEKHTKLEKALRKNNIVIFGLESNNNKSLEEYVIEKLNLLLNLELAANDIDDIFPIGKQQYNKPILVKFTSYLKKRQVLKNVYKLKNINLHQDRKVIVTEDLSVEERNTNKILRKHLQAARSKNLNAYIKGNKLYINGKVKSLEELQNDEACKADEEENTEEQINEEKEKSDVRQHPTKARYYEEEGEEGTSDEQTVNKKRLNTNNSRTTRKQESKMQLRKDPR